MAICGVLHALDRGCDDVLQWAKIRTGGVIMPKIAVIVGSLRKDSLNAKLARNLEAMLPEGATFEYVNIDLPLFNQDLEADFPAVAQAAKDIIDSADGLLIVTPEYCRSVPGVLKNAVDWIGRPWGKSSFIDKPVGMVGASAGPLGAAVAQAEMRNIMVYLAARVMGQPELCLSTAHEQFYEDGTIVEGSAKQLHMYIEAFVDWVEKNKS